MYDLPWFINPRVFFPVLRRILATAPEALHVEHTRTSAEVALWCRAHFPDEHVAMMHYIRIERRLGRLPMRLTRKMEWEPMDWVSIKRIKMPGDFLFPALFGRPARKW